MGGNPIPIDPEVLLRESAWLYALARSLVGDPSTADDVVQETWLAALRRPPRSRERGQVRAFLATVVRRVAGSTARDAASRRARERAASREESVAPQNEGLERLAVQRQLAEALLELREPYRTAVVLRYVEGRAPREIAVLLGVSPEAVRTRISRGLNLLREQLDREYGGDRRAWSLVLGGMAHRSAEAASIVGVFSGGIFVGLKLFLVGAAAVIVTATLWTWLRMPERHASSLSNVGEYQAPGETGIASDAGGLDVPASQTRDERAGIAGSAATRRMLHGRVVSTLDRRPISGARIELQVDDANSRPLRTDKMRDLEAKLERGDSAGAEIVRRQLDLDSVERFPALGSRRVVAMCGEDGRFELEAPANDQQELLAAADDHVPALVKEGSTPSQGELEIALAPSGTIDVDVIDTADAALPGQWLSVALSGKPTPGRPRFDGLPGGLGFGPTNAAGRITMSGLPVGIELTVNLVPQPGQRVRAPTQTSTIDVHQRRGQLTLRVESSGALRGEARPAPASDVETQARYRTIGSATKPLTARVDSEGKFLFERLPAGHGTLELATIRKGARASTSSSQPISIEILAGETTDVGVIDVPSVARLRGHVRDWRDASEDYFVELRFLREGIALARTSLDGDGRFEAWLPPGECVIEVVNKGRVLAAVAAQAPSEDFELDLLAWCAGLRGRVSATTSDVPMLFPHLSLGDPSSPGWSPSAMPEHGPFTIKNGAFRALPLEPGRYSLLVPFGARGATWIPRVELQQGRETDVGELAVGFGSVRGQVVGAGSDSVGGTEVVLSSPFDGVLTTHTPRRAIADEDGKFGFDGVPAGPWQASLRSKGERLGLSSLADVFPNAGTEIEVTLSAEAILDVRVSNHGQPQSDVELVLSQLDGPSPTVVDHTDAAGRIERTGLIAGTWRWSIGGKPSLRAGNITLRAGERRTLEIDLGEGAVVFHVAASTAAAPWVTEAVAWSLDAASAGEMRHARANRGSTFELDVDAGRYLLVMQVHLGEGEGLALDHQRTALVDVATGTRTVEVAPSEVAIELRLEGAARHGTPPRAVLTSLAGLSVESWAITFPSLAIGESLRFSSLPQGSAVKVQGMLPSGGRIERVVTVPPSGTMSVDWR